MGADQSTVQSGATTVNLTESPPLAISLARQHQSRLGHKLKLLIRGERGSGKSLLCNHLKGTSLFETRPTAEIETTTITWTNRNDKNDFIAVEVWDVVDVGIPPPYAAVSSYLRGDPRNLHPESLSVFPTPVAMSSVPPTNAPHCTSSSSSSNRRRQYAPLDASLIDVNRGADAVLVLVDPFSPTALQYLRDTALELFQSPEFIPLMIVINFR